MYLEGVLSLLHDNPDLSWIWVPVWLNFSNHDFYSVPRELKFTCQSIFYFYHNCLLETFLMTLCASSDLISQFILSKFLSPDAKTWLIGKDPDVAKDWGQEEKGATEDEMIGWHHWLNGLKFEQTQGSSEGQGSLACCSPHGPKEPDMTEQLSNCLSEKEKYYRLINKERKRGSWETCG